MSTAMRLLWMVATSTVLIAAGAVHGVPGILLAIVGGASLGAGWRTE